MMFIKTCRVIVLALVFCALSALAPRAFGQESNQPPRSNAQKEEDVNLDTQLYLILATNRDVEEGKMPAALEPVLKRLRESLMFKHYTVAGTFLNRVRNGGRLDVRWVGGAILGAGLGNNRKPTF